MFVFSSLKAVLLCYYRPLLVIAVLLCSGIRFFFSSGLVAGIILHKVYCIFFVVVCISALH
jgi:hypothetical protein